MMGAGDKCVLQEMSDAFDDPKRRRVGSGEDVSETCDLAVDGRGVSGAVAGRDVKVLGQFRRVATPFRAFCMGFDEMAVKDSNSIPDGSAAALVGDGLLASDHEAREVGVVQLLEAYAQMGEAGRSE